MSNALFWFKYCSICHCSLGVTTLHLCMLGRTTDKHVTAYCSIRLCDSCTCTQQSFWLYPFSCVKQQDFWPVGNNFSRAKVVAEGMNLKDHLRKW